MEPLAFAVLKGLTPNDISLDFIDERLESLPESIDSDWLIFSANSFTIKRAYSLIRKFRSKGIKTGIGGVHVTLIPEEAGIYADTVFIGDAEEVYKSFIHDLKNDCVKAYYKSDTYPDISRTYFDETIFDGKKYASITPVQYSRGCKFSCDFCSIHALYKDSRRYRDLNLLVEEIKRRKLKIIFFVDDNLFMEKSKTLELLKAIKPLKVKWVCQISIDVGMDMELLKRMSEAGCMAVLIGFETTNILSLKQMNKGINIKHDNYEKIIKNIKSHGLMVYGTFVIGYDGDTKETFDQLLKFAIDNKLMLANFNPLIPTVATPLYKRLEDEGRLLYDKWWLEKDYKYGDTVFIPKNMTPDELRDGCFKIREAFNTYKSINERLIKEPVNLRNMGIYLAANLISRREIKKKQGRIL
nr:radical SAM protein [Acidaminobacter sp. JC074]